MVSFRWSLDFSNFPWVQYIYIESEYFLDFSEGIYIYYINTYIINVTLPMVLVNYA
jgi:hypothetical protein